MANAAAYRPDKGLLLAVLAILVGASTAACDDSTSVAGAGGSTGSGGTGTTVFSCPASPPSQGTSCIAQPVAYNGNVHCSWGDDPRPECRTRANCDGGAWDLLPPDPGCSQPPLPAACPSPPPADATTCSEPSLGCWYDDGTHCWCSECDGGSAFPVCVPIDPPAWYCALPPPDCPAVIPQAGSSCDVPGASCGPDCQMVIVCEDGVWNWRGDECPICAAPDTPIATPMGARAISSLRPGELVYSVDHGEVVAVPLLRVGRTPVVEHHVMRVELGTGAVLEISPGHPTADGRSFGELQAGSCLDDDHEVISAALVPYDHEATYDILPASSTGTYFAAGALIGSTMFGPP